MSMTGNVPTAFQVLVEMCGFGKLGFSSWYNIGLTWASPSTEGVQKSNGRDGVVHLCNLSTQRAEAGGML